MQESNPKNVLCILRKATHKTMETGARGQRGHTTMGIAPGGQVVHAPNFLEIAGFSEILMLC